MSCLESYPTNVSYKGLVFFLLFIYSNGKCPRARAFEDKLRNNDQHLRKLMHLVNTILDGLCNKSVVCT